MLSALLFRYLVHGLGPKTLIMGMSTMMVEVVKREHTVPTVSYTHLDVYKRQDKGWLKNIKYVVSGSYYEKYRAG